jgi:uncharacterized membrane protein
MKLILSIIAICVLALALTFANYKVNCAYQLGYERGCSMGYVAAQDDVRNRIYEYLGEGDLGTEFVGYAVDFIPLDSVWYNDGWAELTHQDEY